jgi:hypothetical protein
LILLIYLLLAIVRLLVSPIDRGLRGLVFVYRLAILVFAFALSITVMGIMLQLHWSPIWGALIETVCVIAVGEHLIFNALERRGALPPNVPRMPLGM